MYRSSRTALLSILFLNLIFAFRVVALSGARLRQYDLLASLDLLPDGTPISEDPLLDTDWWYQDDPGSGRAGSGSARHVDIPPPDVLKDGPLPASKNVSKDLEPIDTEYVKLPMDHFGDDQGTFNNRFWVSERAYKPGGPVFVYDVGEANASTNGLHLQRLRNSTSFFKQLVDRFNGIGIVWEHRFYGNSSPYNISTTTTADKFEFLTTEQSLADLPTFAWKFKRSRIPNSDLTPAGTPWIFLGGSYPGMRAAFLRRYYPGTIFAAYSSSAPVQASINMDYYFDMVWRGMRAAGWVNCTNDIQAAVREIDRIMDIPEQAPRLKERFLGRGAGNNTNAGFADALSTIFFLYQAYGMEGGGLGLRSLCNWIGRDTRTNTTSPESGWAAVRGVNYTLARWASWPAFPMAVNENLFTKCEGPRPRKMNASQTPNCNLDEKFPEPAQISWTWQYCTQWGFFQSANLGQTQLLSKYNTLRHQHDICHRQFPDGVKKAVLPEWPEVDDSNNRFGGWAIRPSNTYWTGGEFDPWRTLSPLSDESFSPRYEISQDIPDCGRPWKTEKQLFGYLVPGAQHAYDFRTTFEASKPAQQLFIKALEKWLGCWRPPRPQGNGTNVDGGGSWGGGHFNPTTGTTGNLPGPMTEEGWATRRIPKRSWWWDRRKKKRVWLDAETGFQMVDLP